MYKPVAREVYVYIGGRKFEYVCNVINEFNTFCSDTYG